MLVPMLVLVEVRKELLVLGFERRPLLQALQEGQSQRHTRLAANSSV